MTKRLQVLLEDDDYRALQRAAAARGVTVAEWVRAALLAARRQEASGSMERKLDAIRAAVRQMGPTGPIERLNEETERGDGSGALPGVESSSGYGGGRNVGGGGAGST